MEVSDGGKSGPGPFKSRNYVQKSRVSGIQVGFRPHGRCYIKTKGVALELTVIFDA